MSTSNQTAIGRIPESVRKFQPGQKVGGVFTLKTQLDTFMGITNWSVTGSDPGSETTLCFLPAEVLNDQRTLELIRKESRLNRQVIHPHITQVTALLEEKDWAALVTEKINGDSLETLLKKQAGGCFDPADIKVWIGQLCQTMEDAHRAGLLHRNLTPSNLFTSASGDLKIAGFGIQRLILDCVLRGKPAAADPCLAYQSPQVLDGEAAATSDDIYAFGVLMHVLLAGKIPFGEGDIIQQIRRTVPAPLTERRSQAKPGAAPVAKHWDKVIASCLEKQRQARPKSFAEVASKLGIEIPGTTINLPETGKAAPAVAKKPVSEPQAKPAEFGERPATSQAAATQSTSVASQKPTAPEPAGEKKESAPAKQEQQAAQPSRSEPAAGKAEASQGANLAHKEKPPFPRGAFIRDEEEDVVRKAKFPFSTIAAAAVILLGVGIAGVLLTSGKGTKNSEGVAFSPSVSDTSPQITQTRNQEPKQAPPPPVPAASATSEPAASAQPAGKSEAPPPVLPQSAKNPMMSSDEIIIAPSASPSSANSSMPSNATEAQKLVAEKARAAEQEAQHLLEQLKQSSAGAAMPAPSTPAPSPVPATTPVLPHHP